MYMIYPVSPDLLSFCFVAIEWAFMYWSITFSRYIMKLLCAGSQSTRVYFLNLFSILLWYIV